MSATEFDGIEVLLIDGNNLLHRVAGSVEPGAQRLLIARLRSAIPPTIATVLMLDGHAAVGTSRTERVARGFEIRHAGSISADDAILRIVADYPPSERHRIAVVSDDRPLIERARHLGSQTQRLAWLESRVGGSARTEIGGGPRHAHVTGTNEEIRPPWQPGRNATRKRGNPRRRPR